MPVLLYVEGALISKYRPVRLYACEYGTFVTIRLGRPGGDKKGGDWGRGGGKESKG